MPAPLQFTHICDRCGRPLAEGEARYVARVQVFAQADPLKIGADQLQRESRADIRELMDQCAQMSEEELMKDVFLEFRFDLCRRCQRAYIANPLSAVDR